MKDLIIALLLLPVFAFAEEPRFDRETLVFMGSSTIDYWKPNMSRDFRGYKTVNVGVAGTTYGDLARSAAAMAKAYPAKRFVLYSGDNDIGLVGGLRSPEAIAENFRLTVEAIRSQVPDAEILVISIKPSLSPIRRARGGAVRETNALIKAQGERLGGVTYIDVYHRMLTESGSPDRKYFRWDGIHLSEAGYELWKKAVTEKLPPVRLPQEGGQSDAPELSEKVSVSAL